MSINVINTNARPKVATTAGTTREIITADDGAKDLRASIHEVEPNHSFEINSEKRTHLVYVMQGSGGQFLFKGKSIRLKKAPAFTSSPETRPSLRPVARNSS